jgi:hypothetical protein
MKEYIEWNRSKIIFQLKLISIILTIIWAIYIFVQYNKGATLSLVTTILGFIIAAILFPVFIEFMLAMQDFIAFNRYNKVINTEPFNQLTKLGFIKTYTDKKVPGQLQCPR